MFSDFGALFLYDVIAANAVLANQHPDKLIIKLVTLANTHNKGWLTIKADLWYDRDISLW